MILTSNGNITKPAIRIGYYKFECVKKFCYLGSLLHSNIIISEEISKRIILGNRPKAYYCNMNLLRSSLLSRHTKLKICKTLIRPVVVYDAETWRCLQLPYKFLKENF